VFTPTLLIFSTEGYAEKSAVWAYLFLCVTVVQQIYELKKKPKKLYSLNKFFSDIFRIKIDKNDTRTKAILYFSILLAVYIVVKKFWQSLVNIYKAYLLFWTYYPEYKTPPNLVLFCLAILLICFIFLGIAYFKCQNLWRNKLLILIWLFTFQLFANSIVGKFTKFQFQPKMFSISPAETSEAWVDVTINGVNFQDLPFVGKVSIAGIDQGSYLILWSDKKIVVRTNPTVTKSGPVCVQTLSKGNTNCLPFQYNFGKK
jgi:hypothetical protein